MNLIHDYAKIGELSRFYCGYFEGGKKCEILTCMMRLSEVFDTLSSIRVWRIWSDPLYGKYAVIFIYLVPQVLKVGLLIY